MPKTIFDYDVIDFIGEGAASQIYAVSDPKTKQLYALKHVVRKTEKDSRFIEQLENEFNVGKAVVHENLRRIFDYKANRSLLLKVNEAILLMELFDGVPLENSLPRSLSALMQVFIETGKALESLHKLGFVHCDLKPSNILINNAGKIKVIDLGQACPCGTAKKRIQGTPDYIAPEQVKCLPVSFRTDIYNFGATMYWALAGRKMPTLFTVGKGENAMLSDDLIPSLLSASDVLGTGWFGAVAAEAGPGKTVAVVGDGAVGLLAVLAAKQLGAERVIAMSRHESRQRLAREFGATEIVEERGDEGIKRIKELTDGLGAHSIVEAVGTQESMLQAIHATRPGGHVGFVGVAHGVELPAMDLFWSLVHLHGGPAPVRRFLPELIDLIWNRTIDPGRVFDLELPLDQVAEGYRAMDERRAIKTLLWP